MNSLSLLPRLNGLALAGLYLLAAVLPLLLARAQPTAPMDRWEYAAAAMGILALWGMAVQFVTSGRFEAVSGGLGIDKIMAFHKLAALWLGLAVLLHPLVYILPTWLDDPELGWIRLRFYLTDPAYRSGVVSLGALMVLVITSLLRDRLLWPYEAWRGAHLLLALIAVLCGLHHASAVGRFSIEGALSWFWALVALAVLGVVAVLYGWRWWLLRHRPWRLKSVTKRAERMWELDILPAQDTQQMPYHAGQFVWITEGARRFPLFDHPFSIADSPRRDGISLLIKEVGDFTDKIGTLPEGCLIGVDGPYGEFSLEAHPADSVLLIGGGVGIAPILGIVRDMVARGDTRPVRLAYAVGQPQNFACLAELRAATETLDLQLWLLSEDPPQTPNILQGRLTRACLSEMLSGLDLNTTKALICGPGPMVVSVSDDLLETGMPMSNIIYERFDYASNARSRQDRTRASRMLSIGAALLAIVTGFSLSM